MASLTILYWRDIPSQVIVKAGRSAAKRELSERFIRAIDAAAMHAGAKSDDAYLAEWRRGEPIACGDDLEEGSRRRRRAAGDGIRHPPPGPPRQARWARRPALTALTPSRVRAARQVAAAAAQSADEDSGASAMPALMERLYKRFEAAIVARRAALRAHRLRPPRAAGRRARGGRQGLAVRLPDVRRLRAVEDRHVVPDELPEGAAQRPLRRRARQTAIARSIPICPASGCRPTRAASACGAARAIAEVLPPVDHAPQRLVGLARARAREGRRRADDAARVRIPHDIGADPGRAARRPARPFVARPARAGASARRIRRHRRAQPARFGQRRGRRRNGRAIFEGWVDGINATDGSGAHCHMSSVAVCAILTRIGYSPVLQISCRDYNRIAIQGNVLGAAALGVGNVLCLTGDGVQCGDHPGGQAGLRSRFDLAALDHQRDARRGPVPVGAQDDDRRRASSSARPRTRSRRRTTSACCRLAKKIAAGAQFVQTQYCFDLPLLQAVHGEGARHGARPAMFHSGRRRAARLRQGGALDARQCRRACISPTPSSRGSRARRTRGPRASASASR